MAPQTPRASQPHRPLRVWPLTSSSSSSCLLPPAVLGTMGMPDLSTCSCRKRSLRAISSQRLTCGVFARLRSRGGVDPGAAGHRCTCGTRWQGLPRRRTHLVGVGALEGALFRVEVLELQQPHLAQRGHRVVRRLGGDNQLRGNTRR